ncbi:S8 family serine peptidase [Sedimentitalea todarodis]|uniref:S8 family serine peptidase n=1 Tax=Sedimentitalea todarodis TaxID=1631240 RepID=A0ABU3VDY0_9RHOB|nr:S8 family serine peptidase [Sedimentitalea todarodis]MDU9004366.1 S8 family serine peptidase [Sedimentitalea todarodis]
MLITVHTLRRLVLMCLFVALVGCTAEPDLRSGAGAGTPDVVGIRKVIALVPDTQSAKEIRNAARAAGYQELAATHLNGLGLSMLTFRMPKGVTGAEAIAELEAAVPASTVGINHAYRLQQSSVPPDGLDYAGTMIRWGKDGCRARAPIGMIDTGIDTTSPALVNAQIRTRSFFAGSAAPADHGTNVATVLAGPNRLRDATIFSANVFGQSDTQGLKAGADALVRALDWLAEEDVRFVNLALAGPYNKLLDLAVDRATSRGLILVAAVGNEGPQVDPLYPAGFDRVIAVTAVDAQSRIYRKAVRGPHVDVAAPGVDVLVPSGRGARFVTGTSIATPFVTARLAADASLATTQDVSMVRRRLAATSADLGRNGRDRTFGYGLVLADETCGN